MNRHTLPTKTFYSLLASLFVALACGNPAAQAPASARSGGDTSDSSGAGDAGSTTGNTGSVSSKKVTAKTAPTDASSDPTLGNSTLGDGSLDPTLSSAGGGNAGAVTSGQDAKNSNSKSNAKSSGSNSKGALADNKNNTQSGAALTTGEDSAAVANYQKSQQARDVALVQRFTAVSWSQAQAMAAADNDTNYQAQINSFFTACKRGDTGAVAVIRSLKTMTPEPTPAITNCQTADQALAALTGPLDLSYLSSDPSTTKITDISFLGATNLHFSNIILQGNDVTNILFLKTSFL